jgi:hypothetical protein
MGGTLARIGKLRNAYKILVGKPSVKKLLERPRRRGEYDIKMYLRKGGKMWTGSW